MLRHSKYLCDSPVRSAIMKFKLNCQWEVEDSIIKSMIVQHEDEISSETDTLLEKELATRKKHSVYKAGRRASRDIGFGHKVKRRTGCLL